MSNDGPWVVLCKGRFVELLIDVEAYGPFTSHADALCFAGMRSDPVISIQSIKPPPTRVRFGSREQDSGTGAK